MAFITKKLTIIITLYAVNQCATADFYPYQQNNYNDDYNIKQYTRDIYLKQGALKGIVVEPKVNRALPPVEQYRGIPYAAAPVGELRFMPSGSAPSWFGTKYADTYGPVCPQKFPDETKMAPERRAYFLRLKEYLQNQSEDCLYLNIYAPFQGDGTGTRKFPVMIFLHGESFEWNSGNAYDGSVLAAHGKVIVITLNYRLGILGFLKAGIDDFAKSNFGLIDQIAALLWVKDNIAAFGGDPSAVTLFGHGTGAVCASLLMLSPLHGTQMLFQRAILMGGTALSDWALAGNPRAVTYQVSQALNCQFHDDFAGCLRRKRLDEIMSVGAKTSPYKTRFGPVVDSLVVPNDPKKSMAQYSDIFKRFELMYGVTELESIHLLGPVELTHGMLEKERDEELRNYVHSRCEMEPELCLARTLAEYTQSEFSLSDEKYVKNTGHEPDRATMARDALLDILSDARTVAPIVQTARYHAALNLQSYFYVFTHKTSSRDYIRNKSYNGDELPYVFGVPLDGPKFHFVDHYSEKEKLFSEIIMMYFANFAYTGNPNVPRKNEFYSSRPSDWYQYDVEWPEFDIKQERYLQLKIPPQYAEHYRSKEMIYWIDVFPELAHYRQNHTSPRPFLPPQLPKRYPPRGKPPPFVYYNFTEPRKPASENPYKKFENFYKPLDNPPPKDSFGVVKTIGKDRPYNFEKSFGVVHNSPDETENVLEVQQGSSMNIFIITGLFFIVLLNILILGGLYYKCYKAKCKKKTSKQDDPTQTSEEEKTSKINEEVLLENGCNIVRIIRRSSSKSEEFYEGNNSDAKKSKKRLERQMSNSTIDAHTKVRDWITQEIVNRYSPRILRRPRHASIKVPKPTAVTISTDLEKDSTLGRSPTRPVSPNEELSKNSTPTATTNKKINKVSVAIDATPSGRGPSVLLQQPIELTKSLDCPTFPPEIETPLRRSMTLEDFSPRTMECKKELRKSTTNINLKYTPDLEPTVIKIDHSHSRSEPVEDIYGYSTFKRMKTFDPNSDINVTSRDEIDATPLTPEESLMTIKRRNFPKVLPDHPGREALAHKRRSMPAHCLFLPIPENPSMSQPNSPGNKTINKFPPLPPPRTTSSLERNNSLPQNASISEPMLAEEPPVLEEPEVVSNNLFVGQLKSKNKKPEIKKLDSQEIYASLKPKEDKPETPSEIPKPKTIISASPGSQIRRLDPKYVVKPTQGKKSTEGVTKNIPRVVVPDNQPQVHLTPQPIEKKPESTPGTSTSDSPDISSKLPMKVVKSKPKSHIPTPIKNMSTNKESSSSDSTPSEESDTGTVVKRI